MEKIESPEAQFPRHHLAELTSGNLAFVFLHIKPRSNERTKPRRERTGDGKRIHGSPPAVWIVAWASAHKD